MLEFLLEDEFESFRSANIYEKKEGLDRVKKLLNEEDDPLVRSMGKTYVDRLAGRMDLIQSVDSFQALERSFMQALAEAGPPPPPRGPMPKEARITATRAGSMERRDIVGALIEYPSLMSEPEVQEVLNLLEGPSATTVAALSRAVAAAPAHGPPRGGSASDVPHPEGESHKTREKSLDTSSFLAQIPPTIQAFAAERLAAPQHETREEALRNLLENGRKLRNVVLERETLDISRETYKAGGDWDAEVELARTAHDRMRERHGVGATSRASARPPAAIPEPAPEREPGDDDE